MNVTAESRVKQAVRFGILKTVPSAYIFMPVQTGYGARTLDYLCCINGRFVAIETKAPGKYPTKFQELTGKAIANAGGLVVSPAWHEDHVMEALRAKGIIV